LGIIRQRGNVPIGVKHQQMILLRVTVLVVDFLSDQEQDAAPPDPIISLDSLNENVVVGHDDRVQSRFDGGFRNVLVGARPI